MGQRKRERKQRERKKPNRGQRMAEMTPFWKISVNSLIHKEEGWGGEKRGVGGSYTVFVSGLKQPICHLQQERSRLPDSPIGPQNNTCL